MVGDGQRITVSAITELELALEVGTPQIIGKPALRQRRAARTVARPAAPLDQAVAVEHRMDGAFGGNPDVPVEATLPAHLRPQRLLRKQTFPKVGGPGLIPGAVSVSGIRPHRELFAFFWALIERKTTAWHSPRNQRPPQGGSCNDDGSIPRDPDAGRPP